MDVSIVIVTHNTKELLEDCIQSIFRQNCTLKYEIIIVDNGSSDGTYEYFRNYKNCFIVRNEISNGFGHGVNTGVAYSKGRNIFILEPDTILITPNSIERLSSFLDNHKKVAVVAPQLILKRNERVQRSAFESFPDIFTLIMEWTMLNIIMGKLFPSLNYPGKYYLTEADMQHIRKVAWVMGGIAMIKKNVFQEIEGMDEAFYLLFEDTDLLKRISDKKYETWYLPDVRIEHYWGVNQTNILNNVNLYYRSFKTYFGKHNKLVLKAYPSTIVFVTFLSIPIFLVFFIINKMRDIDFKNMLLFRFYLIKKLIGLKSYG